MKYANLNSMYFKHDTCIMQYKLYGCVVFLQVKNIQCVPKKTLGFLKKTMIFSKPIFEV